MDDRRHDRRIGIAGAAATVVAIGVALLWLGCSESPEGPSPEAPAPEAAQPPPPDPTAPDVVGLPPLFQEGAEYEESSMSLEEYFAKFGPALVMDPETKKVRPDLVAVLREELVGKQVTWDGYVKRIKDAPSGRVMLVLALKPEQTGLDSAMVMYSSAWAGYLRGYRHGERVRVVAVFDGLVTAFPSLRGISVEAIPAEE